MRADSGAELPGVLAGQLLLRRLQEALEPLLVQRELGDARPETGGVLGPRAAAPAQLRLQRADLPPPSTGAVAGHGRVQLPSFIERSTELIEV